MTLRRSHLRSSRLDPAFEDFVIRVSPRLMRTAYLLTGDRGHAEDLLQTTLLRTATRWSAAIEQPEAFARRVLINLSRDRWRLLGRRAHEDYTADAADLPTRDLADGVVARATVLPALRQLPRRQREVIVLRFFADLSVAETAAILRCSEGAIKSHCARGLARLRTLLTEPEDAEVQHVE